MPEANLELCPEPCARKTQSSTSGPLSSVFDAYPALEIARQLALISFQYFWKVREAATTTAGASAMRLMQRRATDWPDRVHWTGMESRRQGECGTEHYQHDSP